MTTPTPTLALPASADRCNTCQGWGRWDDVMCGDCSGSGLAPRPKPGKRTPAPTPTVTHHRPENVAFVGVTTGRDGNDWLNFSIESRSETGVTHVGKVRLDASGARWVAAPPKGGTLLRDPGALVRCYWRWYWARQSDDARQARCAWLLAQAARTTAQTLEFDALGDIVAERLAARHGVATGRAA